MINDQQLNDICITFGLLSMVLVVIYHALASTQKGNKKGSEDIFAPQEKRKSK
ncbi:hypothetical protein KAFR_0F00220 [Kazachstania africana CBS 2517]|uniref:Uncharacterized protein n=1 Tax=Kazachstania africana (strain ATCC 22294 / BCRC 22015 / CBS 2517 / CECT 1963 / NBRC 1671 / NRRL Y-8276) TaxID=1071382 RepID=H2AW69_KAZAF|nr:hypothetical protein KAFR_0F00220 [Kazachstania africana CBS 2517]CCF58619.1 hypothetical protein KAFR_0F00220 [Kazachstania africana CBS 2517]